MNALKHGLSAKAIVLEDEDPREFEALLDGNSAAGTPRNDE
jgi:hypothetical protein